MEKKNKTRSQYVLDALMTGKSLLSSDITRMVSDASGEETKIQAIDRLMIKLSNSWAFQIGHFINKNKTPQGYEYSLVPEMLNLTPEEIYDLTRQTGKNRFNLEMALEKIPELGKYVKKSKVTKEKTVLKIDPEMQEPLLEAETSEDIVAVFLNEIKKIGGLKVNFCLKVKFQKDGNTFSPSNQTNA